MVRAIGVALVGVLAFVVGGVAYAYFDIQGNITALDVNELVDRAAAPDEPGTSGPAPTPSPTQTFVDPAAGQALNILVMGTDDRSGDNVDLGGEGEGMRSDTTLLVHVSGDRSRVDVVSIPRDLLVPIPECPLPDSSTVPATSEAMFNSAFSRGSGQSETGSEEAKQFGVACTIRAVQEMSGLTIDEFALVDFAGFQAMVDAIGGIDVCLGEPIQDRYTDLDLPAGAMHLDGWTALQLARVRHNVGDGSDISRIDRQQQLLTVLISEVLDRDVFTSGPELYRFLSAATSSLTTSPDLAQLPRLAGLAMSLRHTSIEDITFATLPFEYAGNRVRPIELSDELWAAVAGDEPLWTVLPELAPPATPAPPEGDGADSGVSGGAGSQDGSMDGGPVETATDEPTEHAPTGLEDTGLTPGIISATCG